jgi:hypothetical protein
MMNVHDRQIEAPAVLGHREMDAVVVDVLPLKRQCLALAKAGEKYQPIERRMNRVGGVAKVVEIPVRRSPGS